MIPQIDREDPKCLYCHSELDSDVEASWNSNRAAESTYFYRCEICFEQFRVFLLRDAEKNFFFTCKDICVLQDFQLSEYGLSTLDKSEVIWVPQFEIDFSDKEALWLKLKTYITFS